MAKPSEERAKRCERLEPWADEQSRAEMGPAPSGKAATGKGATKPKGEKKPSPQSKKSPSDKVLQERQ